MTTLTTFLMVMGSMYLVDIAAEVARWVYYWRERRQTIREYEALKAEADRLLRGAK